MPIFAGVAARRLKTAMKRVGQVLLEDFGLRPTTPPADGPIEVSEHAEAPAAEDGPPCLGAVVWTGSAARGPELQAFVDHLMAVRTGAAQSPSR